MRTGARETATAGATQRHSDASGMPVRLVVFSLDGDRYAVPLAATERALPMVAISPLPDCPDVVLGAVNVHGEVVPVLDPRRALGRRTAEVRREAHLLLVRTARRRLALAVDSVLGVSEVAPDAVTPPGSVHPAIERLAGVVALADGLLLIHDLDAFLSPAEERELDESLRRSSP